MKIKSTKVCRSKKVLWHSRGHGFDSHRLQIRARRRIFAFVLFFVSTKMKSPSITRRTEGRLFGHKKWPYRWDTAVFYMNLTLTACFCRHRPRRGWRNLSPQTTLPSARLLKCSFFITSFLSLMRQVYPHCRKGSRQMQVGSGHILQKYPQGRRADRSVFLIFGSVMVSPGWHYGRSVLW